MMRLRNEHGIRVVVADDTASKMIAGLTTVPGCWESVPATEQLTKQESDALDRAAAASKAAMHQPRGRTNISAGIEDLAPGNRYAS